MRTRREFITLVGSAAAICPVAVSARKPAVSERTFRQGLNATSPIESERGRAVFRILFGCLLLSGAMAMAAAENAPGVADSEIKIGQTMPYTGPGDRREPGAVRSMISAGSRFFS